MARGDLDRNQNESLAQFRAQNLPHLTLSLLQAPLLLQKTLLRLNEGVEKRKRKKRREGRKKSGV